MYHRFDGQSNSASRLPDKKVLSRQVDLIRAHHPVITPDDHLQILTGAVESRCPVVLTVDDGYADFWEIAYPVFKEAGIPAMLFVTTGFVSGDIWFWWDRLRYLIENARPHGHRFTQGDMTFALDLNSPQGREKAWHETADYCRFLADNDKEKFIIDLGTRLGVDVPPTPPANMSAATWDQIRQMAADGMLFGAHTVNHPILTRVPQDAVLAEMNGSKIRLEKELGHHIGWFCYPQGGPADYNSAIRAQAAELFRGAYVAFMNLDNDGDAFTLPRYGATRDLTAFRWALCGAEHLVLRLRKLVGLRTGVGDAYWAGNTPRESV